MLSVRDVLRELSYIEDETFLSSFQDSPNFNQLVFDKKSPLSLLAFRDIFTLSLFDEEEDFP